MPSSSLHLSSCSLAAALWRFVFVNYLLSEITADRTHGDFSGPRSLGKLFPYCDAMETSPFLYRSRNFPRIWRLLRLYIYFLFLWELSRRDFSVFYRARGTFRMRLLIFSLGTFPMLTWGFSFSLRGTFPRRLLLYSLNWDSIETSLFYIFILLANIYSWIIRRFESKYRFDSWINTQEKN